MATLSQLTYAIAVDRFRNFRKAAKASHVTQPTLSGQLLKLEDELGVTLFDRDKSPVAPTREGEALLEQFRVVLREHDLIGEIVKGLKGVVAGEYRLGIIPTMGPTLLPRIIPPFLEAYPEVQLWVEELTTEGIVARLGEETLDGGILAAPLGDHRLSEFPIWREAFYIYHSPDLDLPLNDQGQVSLETLPPEHLMIMGQGHCLRTQTLDLCAMGRAASENHGFKIEAGSLGTLCAMVQQGGSYTVLPALSAQELRARGHGDLIKEIAGDVPYRQIALVTRRQERRRGVRQALLETARDTLKGAFGPNRAHQPSPVPPLNQGEGPRSRRR